MNLTALFSKFNLKKLFKSEYARNASVLMLGTTLGMIIQVAASPVLSRMYADDDFGVLQLYTSAYAILSILATMRYELAILLPKDDEDAFDVLSVSCFCSIFFGILCFVFVTCVSVFNISLFGLNQVTWLKYVPLTAAVMGLYYSFNYWLNRRKRYMNLAINRVLQNVLIVALSVVFSPKVLGIADGMILAYLIAMCVVTVLLIIYVWIDYCRLQMKFSFRRILQMAKRYRRFPINTMPTGLINNFAVQMPVFILSHFFGDGVVGQYYMMNRVLGTPVSIIGQAIGDVFRQRSSQAYAEKGECKKLYATTAKALALIAIVPFALLMVIAKPGFAWILGDEWELAGAFVMLLAPFYFIRLVVSPLTSMTIIAEKQTYELIWQITMCVTTSLAMVAGCWLFNGSTNMHYYVAMVAYATMYSIMYIVHFMYTRQLARGKKLWG